MAQISVALPLTPAVPVRDQFKPIKVSFSYRHAPGRHRRFLANNLGWRGSLHSVARTLRRAGNLCLVTTACSLIARSNVLNLSSTPSPFWEP